MKKSTLISLIFTLIALIGAAAAIVAYIKSKKAAQQIREDFLADLGYEFDDVEVEFVEEPIDEECFPEEEIVVEGPEAE